MASPKQFANVIMKESCLKVLYEKRTAIENGLKVIRSLQQKLDDKQQQIIEEFQIILLQFSFAQETLLNHVHSKSDQKIAIQWSMKCCRLKERKHELKDIFHNQERRKKLLGMAISEQYKKLQQLKEFIDEAQNINVKKQKQQNVEITLNAKQPLTTTNNTSELCNIQQNKIA